MVQIYDYENNTLLNFDDVDSLCSELKLNKKHVIKAISRESKILKRYIITYGKIDTQLIKDKMPLTYIITDIQNDESNKFNSFVDLVNYANKVLKSDYPASHYHRNMKRNNISYGRFIIRKGH